MKVMYGNTCKHLDDGKHTSCEICGKKLSCRGGSTSALRKTLAFTAPVGVHCPLVPMNRQRQEQILSLYKKTKVYTNIIEISVILIKQSYMIDLQAF